MYLLNRKPLLLLIDCSYLSERDDPMHSKQTPALILCDFRDNRFGVSLRLKGTQSRENTFMFKGLLYYKQSTCMT